MSNHSRKIILSVPIIYVIIVSVLLFWHRVGFSPDQFFALALVITVILGRSKQFILDWSVPVVLLLSYDYLRGLVPKLSLQVHIFPMINFDQAIFGILPSIGLQKWLFGDGIVHWYDYLATVLYMSHFVVPMVVAFILWLKNRAYFRSYSLGLLILSYAAFFTYIAFPAMPPWMAAQQGFIPALTKVMEKVFANLPQPVDLFSVYRFVGANLVAAVPSLHAAYPMLTLLFIAAKYKIWGILFLPYMLGVWFAIVYLGEHYVFDIVVGAAYAVMTFLLIIHGDIVWKKTKVSFYYLKGGGNR